MWPISTRVNKPENDDPSIVEPDRTGNGRGVGPLNAWALVCNKH